ncbi:MAG: hypothetical protein OXF93_14480 [Acidobacteria bacterium]|nr:hypothetical protein [Acidobacteriota bacterium]
MPFIPKEERPSLALLARLADDQASELSAALNAASAELDGDDLVQYVINQTRTIEADDVKKILNAVRQVASAKEILEVPTDVFLNDVAEGMGKVEEQEHRLDASVQIQLRERLAKLTQSQAMEFHAKARSLQQDRENTYCRARIITDLRPVFGSDVRQSPKAVLVTHMLRITYHHGGHGRLRDLFLTLRTEDLDRLSELIERARQKAGSLHAFTAATDLREVD